MDKDVAKIVGCSINTVIRRRKKLGVAPYNKKTISQKNEKHSRERIDWPVQKEKLGRMTDNKLAEIIGCRGKAVSARRRSLGVAPFTEPKRINWDEIDGNLGRSPDAALAERFNCSTYAIKNRRRQLGVSAYERHTQGGKRGKLGTIHSLTALRSA
jgi:hypothetical protein